MQPLPEMQTIPEDMPLTVRNVAGVIAENHYICHATAAKLSSLQSWVREQEKVGR